MDPISTLSLVANIFEVISFASELVSTGNRIYHSADGLQDKDITAEELANDLRDLTTGLSNSQAKWMQAHGSAPLDANDLRLRNICERCNETAVELGVQLQKLRVKDGAKFRRLKAYRQALVSVWREDEVEKLSSRLEKYQRELDTHVLVGLRESARAADIRSDAQFKALDQRTQQTVLTVLEIDKKLDTRLEDQAHLLGRVYDNTELLLTARRTPSPLPPYEEVLPPRPRATQLHAAAKSGDLLQMKRALRSWDVDVNARDSSGCSPLHLASTADIAKRLISTDSLRLNAEDNEGRSALHHAVLKRRPRVVKVLLEAGIDQSMEDDTGRTAAFYAQGHNTCRWMLRHGPETEAIATDHLNNTGLFHMAWLGDLEGTKLFIDQGANVNARNTNGETALTEASLHGSLEVVNLLLLHGARIDVATDGEHWTPLLQAVRNDRREVVRSLLQHGADKHIKRKGGLDAVAEASCRGHHEIARMLIENGSRLESLNHHGRTPLLEASRRNDGEWTEWLLRRGAKTDVRDANGRSPVWHAANGYDGGHHRSLAALLRYKCPVETLDDKNWSPLGCAAFLGNFECVELLLDAGAAIDTHQAHGSGYTALCEACHHNRTDVVRLFVKRGANLEIGSRSGFSALSIAAHNGRDEVIKILADAGANLDKPGSTNMDPSLSETPLMRAILAGKTSTALLLIDLGADVNVRNADGKTALMHAAWKKNASVAAALIAKGADVDAVSLAKWETALMMAAVRGNIEITSMLLEAKANPLLRDWRGCTAWIMAKQVGQDVKLHHILGPKHVKCEEERLLELQNGASVDDIASRIRALYP